MEALASPPHRPPLAAPARPAWRRAWQALHDRQPTLAVYGAVLIALMLPMALGWALDPRELRGASVWIKPMKFALSIAVLAWTTAWFVGHLVPEQRSGRAVRWIVALVIASGSFEFVYIALQAALGQGSHYNVGDAFHGAMYTLMGIGAIVLTATQPMLAWQLRRHADPSRPAALRLAVQLGLVLTFALGAGAGMLLGGLQPPDAVAGASVPLAGWSLSGGDLRPAHFIGIHAEQVLPLAALVLGARAGRLPTAVVWVLSAAWTALFAVALVWGLPTR